MRRETPSSKASPSPFYSILDFGFEVYAEKIENNGEDSFLYSFTPGGGVVGVFDGCGGSGAKRYEKYRNKTGAYMASRAAAGAVKDWFFDQTADQSAAALKERLKRYLAICKEVGGGTNAFKGSLSKDFPTTAALIIANASDGLLSASCLWAGDSRCYLLDADGLKQLTLDDLSGQDAMQNLSSDGVIKNVISASKDFEIHEKSVKLSKPGFLFAATDGCFGYLYTPMEFEHLLLSTLLAAENVHDWEERVSAALQSIAGDDYSMIGMAFGFGSFENLKKNLSGRSRELYAHYIQGIDTKTHEEKTELWNEYKTRYYSFH